MDQFPDGDRILDTRKKSLRHTIAPPQQPEATFTSDLQISRPYPGFLLVPEVAWPEMTRTAALGTTQTPVGTKAPISASASSLQVQSPELQHLATGGRGRTRLPLAPMGGRAQVGELGLRTPAWHTQEKQPPALPSQPRSRPLSLSPHPKTLSVNFTNAQPLWASSLRILREY